MERDSVSTVIGRNSPSISERVSGSRRLLLFRVGGAPRAYQYGSPSMVLARTPDGILVCSGMTFHPNGEDNFRCD